jgi:hypothetical protein
MRMLLTRRLNADFCLSGRMSIQEAELCRRDRVYQPFGCSRAALQAVRGHASEMVKKSSCSVLPYDGTRTFKQALKRSRKVVQASFCQDDGIFSLFRRLIRLPVACSLSDLFSCTYRLILGRGSVVPVLFARHTPHALCDRVPVRSARHTPDVPARDQEAATNHHENVNQKKAGWLNSRQVTLGREASKPRPYVYSLVIVRLGMLVEQTCFLMKW